MLYPLLCPAHPLSQSEAPRNTSYTFQRMQLALPKLQGGKESQSQISLSRSCRRMSPFFQCHPFLPARHNHHRLLQKSRHPRCLTDENASRRRGRGMSSDKGTTVSLEQRVSSATKSVCLKTTASTLETGGAKRKQNKHMKTGWRSFERRAWESDGKLTRAIAEQMYCVNDSIAQTITDCGCLQFEMRAFHSHIVVNFKLRTCFTEGKPLI